MVEDQRGKENDKKVKICIMRCYALSDLIFKRAFCSRKELCTMRFYDDLMHYENFNCMRSLQATVTSGKWLMHFLRFYQAALLTRYHEGYDINTITLEYVFSFTFVPRVSNN